MLAISVCFFCFFYLLRTRSRATWIHMLIEVTLLTWETCSVLQTSSGVSCDLPLSVFRIKFFFFFLVIHAFMNITVFFCILNHVYRPKTRLFDIESRLWKRKSLCDWQRAATNYNVICIKKTWCICQVLILSCWYKWRTKSVQEPNPVGHRSG